MSAPPPSTALGPLDAPGWRGPEHKGHYEAWYLTFHEPRSGRGVWLRHTLHVDPRGRGHAGLWGFVFERGRPGLVVRDRLALGAWSFHDGAVRVGEALLDGGRCRGRIGERLAWDLTLTSRAPARGVSSFRHVPPLLEKLGLASTVLRAPELSLAVAGHLTVDGARVAIEGAVGERGHVSGRRHAPRWAWAHVHGFDDRPDDVVEGCTAEVKRAGLRLPLATPLVAVTGGRRLAWDGPRSVFRPSARFGWDAAGGHWNVDATRKRTRLALRVSAPPEAFVAVEYEDPDGRRLWCHHTEVADAELELGAERLVARGRVAFELAGDAPDPRVTRKFALDA